MSITVVSSLPSVLPVGNSDVVIVSSNLTASANFRYVCDVSGTLSSARLKCDKLPTTSYGFFGVSKVVETLIVPSVPQLTSGWQDAGYAVNVNLTFREEYGTPPSIATGGTASASLIAWQAAFRQQDYSSYSPSAYIASAVSGDVPISKRFSNRPASSTLSSSDSDFIGVLTQVTGISLAVLYVGASRAIFNVSGNTSGILSNIINAGPYGLYNLTSSQCSDGLAGSVNFPANGGQINVQVAFNVSGNLNTSFTKTKIITYTIDNCERYNPLRVFFRNMYGGIDGYTFTRKNRQRVDVQRKTFAYNNSVYGDDVFDKQWSVTYRDTYTLNSDWLSDDEFTWLQEMIYSPECWIVVSGALVPVVVKTDSYTVRKRVIDKLQQISVDVQIGYENTAL